MQATGMSHLGIPGARAAGRAAVAKIDLCLDWLSLGRNRGLAVSNAKVGGFSRRYMERIYRLSDTKETGTGPNARLLASVGELRVEECDQTAVVRTVVCAGDLSHR